MRCYFDKLFRGVLLFPLTFVGLGNEKGYDSSHSYLWWKTKGTVRPQFFFFLYEVPTFGVSH